MGINFIPEEFLVWKFKFKNKVQQYCTTYIIPNWHLKQNYNFSDIPPENWKCNFQIKFYTGDDIQPKMWVWFMLPNDMFQRVDLNFLFKNKLPIFRKSRNNVRKPRGFRKIDFAKNVNRIRIDGTCCIKIYKSKRYRGENQFLGRGFDNIPNFSTIRSFKYGFCNEF